jgi:L-cystine uptake protein TcyP (sodium:dicarboxylate symporter family)
MIGPIATYSTIFVLINLAIAVAIGGLMYRQQRKEATFTVRVLTGLVLGVLLGAAMHLLYSGDASTAAIITTTNAYLDIVGTGYVKLLQMIVMPLIMVSIVGAILKLNGASELGKISALTIGTLLATTAVAAGIGIMMAKFFGLTAVGLSSTAAEVARGEYLQGTLANAKAISLPSLLLSFIPTNPFLDITGARKTSTIAVVIFSIFIGLSATGIATAKPLLFASFTQFVNVAHAIIMRMVSMVLRLTPYGVFALIAMVVAESSYADILKLINFVVASYSALLLMFGVHLCLIAGAGLNPVKFAKRYFRYWRLRLLRAPAWGHSYECADSDPAPGNTGRHCEFRCLIWCNDRSERLCRNLSCDAGDHDRANGGHRSIYLQFYRAVNCDCDDRFDRRCRCRWRRDLCCPDRSFDDEFASRISGTVDFRGTLN